MRKTRTSSGRCPESPAHTTVDILEKSLQSIKGIFPSTEVTAACGPNRHPDGLKPYFTPRESKELEILVLGLEVPPIYRDPSSLEVYPVFFRQFRNRFSEALNKTIFDFIRVQTSCDVAHYSALGRSQIDSSVWHIDKELAEIERSYQFLLLLAPINSDQEWETFKKHDFNRIPKFRYRLLPIDPDLLKKKLYSLNINHVHDPALAYLFRDKREELDKQVSMLAERNTSGFLYNSIRLYKGVDDELRHLAQGILTTVPPEEGGDEENSDIDSLKTVDAKHFAERAGEEFDYYRGLYRQFSSSIEVREDIPGLMVSHGNLLIPTTMTLLPERVNALINHEVGTHVLTYVNGSAQPLQQLKYGLADYDELQEGLAGYSGIPGGRLEQGTYEVIGRKGGSSQCAHSGG